MTAISISPTLLLSAPVTAQNITAAQDGTGTVVLPNGARFDITGGTQAGANLFHSFQQFGLNQGQIANFLSQPSIQNILGRVVGGDPSVINGLIQLTGGNSNLYIMNPAGIIFGSNASLNVPAAFTVTTANGIQVGNAWFGMNTSASDLKNLTGSPNAFAFTTPTTATQASGVILNQGNLSVPIGKSITLVGGIVINTGTISTPNGKINIVAVPDGKYVRITPEGSALSFDLSIATQQEIGNAKPMTVVDLPNLLAGTGITAPTQAGTTIASGNLDVSGDQGGKVQVLGSDVSLVNANINASGLNGGGTVLIGGDLQGTGTTPKSQVTTVDQASTIRADALTNGNGGTVVVWSDGITKFDGKISAKAGALSGNGGLVETSGKTNLAIAKTAQVNTSAPQGVRGTWLLDPTTITVVASGGSDATVASANANAGASTIDNSVIVAALDGTNVNLTASNAITVNAAIDSSLNALAGDLTLSAPTANLNAPITLEPTSTLSGTATTVNVGALGTVQNGVDVATATGTVNLAAATYTLANTVNIDKDLIVRGAGAANTTVSGNNAVRVFNITSGNVTFDGLTITNGKTLGFTDGGGIYNVGSGILTVNNSIVSNNTAGKFGGGIEVEYGTLILTNSTVLGNTAGGFGGGGIDAYGGVITLINSFVSGNSSLQGGGIWSAGTVTLTNSTVSSNSATNDGGGIWSAGTVTLTNSNVSSNSATNDGGGIWSGGTMTITNSTVSGNSAVFGGGIYSDGDVTLATITVSGNKAANDGGGIYVNNGGIITNSTIANNTAQGTTATTGGGGIYNFNPDNFLFTLTNSIIAGNIDLGGLTPDLGSNAENGNYTNGGNNIISANDGFAATFPTSTLIGTIASPVDPKLAPLANYGGTTQTHALLPNSPALDAGNNASATATDQRGAPRIFNGTVDIGAFESQGFSLTPLANTTPQSANVNTTFAQLLGVQVTENFVNSPIPAANILVTFAPPSSSASGAFATNASLLTNNLGIAVAPTFTANGISGSYSVAATATGFTPAAFSLTNAALPVTNKVVIGFGGVYPSREYRGFENISFTQVLCLDAAISTAQTTSIPTCKIK